ncbi:MAG: PRC-barrel domain-containing protein [Xanthobacteraceae bacterium]
MLKTIMITTALSSLLLSPVLAQSLTPRANQSTTETSSSMSSGAAPEAHVIVSQSSNQWLVSKFEGSDVLGSDNQKIGSVTDILFDEAGKIDAYVVGVGGFLGIGEKDVALAPSSFQLVKSTDSDAVKLKTSMTKDQLKQASAFRARASISDTTGSGMNGSPRPSTNH